MRLAMKERRPAQPFSSQVEYVWFVRPQRAASQTTASSSSAMRERKRASATGAVIAPPGLRQCL